MRRKLSLLYCLLWFASIAIAFELVYQNYEDAKSKKNFANFDKEEGLKYQLRDPPTFEQHTPIRFPRAATARVERLWDYAVIPYEIESHFNGANRSLFRQAMRHWENFTCIRFVERNTDHPNYIVFTERPCGCCSFVGKRGNGPQAISIGKNCDKFGIVVHELGHVVGFWHEHTRPDRDQNVGIVMQNIMEGQEYNFNKLGEDEVNSLGVPYDHDSIMHYSRNTFAKNSNLDTIMPREDPVNKIRPEIGQRLRLSQGDITQTMLLYRCPKCGRTIQEASGIIESPNFPNSSPPAEGELCEWRITATHGERIVLNITNIDIYESPNCDNSFLEIRDGYWKMSPLLGRFCGFGEVQNSLVSTGHRMLITYKASPNQHKHRGFNATFEVVCGGEIMAEKGFLQSPNYPDEYHPNKECVWKITVPKNYQVALKFQSFEIENHTNCVYDYLEIRDGHASSSPLIGKFCTHRMPNDIRSSNNHLYVKFVSDSSVNKAGFSALFMKEFNECLDLNHDCEHECLNTLGGYKCECRIGYELHSDGKKCEVACGGLIEGHNGTITSPSFPDLYPPNKHCIWEIVAQPNFRITLNFTYFDLEGNNQDCEYDKLDIKSKNNDHYSKHGIFCGHRIPPLITSVSNNLRLEFTSDNSVQRGGFSLNYFTDKDECADGKNGGCQHICRNTIGSYVCECNNGFVLHENGHDCKEGSCSYQISSSTAEIISPNYPEYYPNKKDCAWHFIATPGHRIKLHFSEFDLEPSQDCNYDYIAIFEGLHLNDSSLGRFCGSKVPHTITSSTNKAHMNFKTDASVQRKGFKAHYSTVCGGRLLANGSLEHLYSHAKYGDANYDRKEDCDWQINAVEGKRIYLKFVTFELENETNCSYDYVEIFDGYDDSSHSLGKFCGHKMPNDTISSADSLLIRFRTDESIHSKGFTLTYSAIEARENELTEDGDDEHHHQFSNAVNGPSHNQTSDAVA